MKYEVLANPRTRQEAQRCLRSYHEAYRLRRGAAGTSDFFPTSNKNTSTSSAPFSSSAIRQGDCWRFYRGELPASPGSERVDDLLAYGGESSTGRILHSWSPEELEYRHDYIQWLFPLRERGVNRLAPLLTTAEAEEMQQDGLIMARVLQAFRVMLRFYGTEITYTTKENAASNTSFKLLSTSDNICLGAQLRRTADCAEWAIQYGNLVHHSHNYLRISRILQFLGEVGLEPLKLGWLEYLAQEVIASGPAQAAPPLAACRVSFFFWMETPYEKRERERLQALVVKLACGSASSEATTTGAGTGPVVSVKNLLLPPTLDVTRVIASGQLRSAAPPRSDAQKKS